MGGGNSGAARASEVGVLVRLAAPAVAAQLGTMTMGFVDTAMLGHFGLEALASAALGNLCVFGTLIAASGFVLGIDPFVTQAHGRGDGRAAAIALQRGVVVGLGVSLPLAVLWIFVAEFLHAVGQTPALIGDAADYVAVQIPSIPCFMLFAALRQYLQGREFMRPAMWVVLIANVVNALLNWCLIFGNAGFPALGLTGAGIATSIVRVTMLLVLIGWILAFRLHAGAWVPWSREVLEWRGLRRILSVGTPIAVYIGLEIWAFGAASLISGRISPLALAAHTVAMQMAAFTFMIPLGISQATVTRVGNLLGAGRPQDAQRTAWIAIGLGASVMGLCGVVMLTLRFQLPLIFTSDLAVIAAAAGVLPFAAAFQVFDGTQAVASGVLRGMGKTRPAAVFNFLGYWVFALPLGGWLALSQGWGLTGVWTSLCIGLAVVAVSMVSWIALRGPARQFLAD
ncbi:MATE family efflux transporter [Myxococcota bacterium]|nr:MATE family efflux transporter [Myxococcota bacterium]